MSKGSGEQDIMDEIGVVGRLQKDDLKRRVEWGDEKGRTGG